MFNSYHLYVHRPDATAHPKLSFGKQLVLKNLYLI